MKKVIEKDAALTVELARIFSSAPEAFRGELAKIEVDRKKSIGLFRPHSWFIELTYGCNLSCGFCVTRLFPTGTRKFMSLVTWKKTIDLMKVINPVCRIDMGNAGEPTLNPNILEMFQYVRKTCPTIQTLMYTNGITLLQGRVSYEKLFGAGLNMIFVDVYAGKWRHTALAERSGYQWIDQDNRKADDINIFEYQNDPDIHRIMLCRNPGDWRRGKMSTWLNNLDWNAAKDYGLKPVKTPPARRCDQPFKYANVFYDGSYGFCCQDAMREVAGKIGHVNSGIDGFFKFWFGKYMQKTRALLDQKNRAAHSLCKRCDRCQGRSDIPQWKPELLRHWWNGKTWSAV